MGFFWSECVYDAFYKNETAQLSSTQMALMQALAHCMNDKTNDCFPSITHLVEMTHLSKASISRALEELVKKKYLEYKSGGAKNGRNVANRYIFTLPKGGMNGYRTPLTCKAFYKNAKNMRVPHGDAADSYLPPDDEPSPDDPPPASSPAVTPPATPAPVVTANAAPAVASSGKTSSASSVTPLSGDEVRKLPSYDLLDTVYRQNSFTSALKPEPKPESKPEPSSEREPSPEEMMGITPLNAGLSSVGKKIFEALDNPAVAKNLPDAHSGLLRRILELLGIPKEEARIKGKVKLSEKEWQRHRALAGSKLSLGEAVRACALSPLLEFVPELEEKKRNGEFKKIKNPIGYVMTCLQNLPRLKDADQRAFEAKREARANAAHA